MIERIMNLLEAVYNRLKCGVFGHAEWKKVQVTRMASVSVCPRCRQMQFPHSPMAQAYSDEVRDSLE